MKVFLDNLPLGDIPGPPRQPGTFFQRLVAVRLSSAGNQPGVWLDVEPVYIPLLRVHRNAGQVMIEINSSRPLVYITLQLRPPYLHVFRFPWYVDDL